MKVSKSNSQNDLPLSFLSSFFILLIHTSPVLPLTLLRRRGAINKNQFLASGHILNEVALNIKFSYAFFGALVPLLWEALLGADGRGVIINFRKSSLVKLALHWSNQQIFLTLITKLSVWSLPFYVRCSGQLLIRRGNWIWVRFNCIY